MLVIAAVVGLAAYRCTRFVLRDSLIEGWRSAALSRLLTRPSLIRHKLYELGTCPYCVSVWAAAACTAIADASMSVPAPVLVWLAGCGAAMIVWELVEA